MLRTALVLAILVTVASLGFATPLTINYVSCTGCGGGTAPYYSSTTTNPVVDFTFSVANWAILSPTIYSLADVTVSFEIYKGTGSTVQFADATLASGAVDAASYIHTGSGGGTLSSPSLVSNTTSDPVDMTAFLSSISGSGQFTLQITNEGDSGGLFNKTGAASGYWLKFVPTVAIDANLTPEPASFALIGFGLLGIAALRKRSKR